MKPTVHDRPLKIIHDLPYPTDADLSAKCRAATDYLTLLLERGFGGIVTNVSTHYDYTQNDEEWQVFAHLAAECERLGLRLWIYDEKGYPSGAAGGLTLAENPDYEATAVVMVTKAVAPGERVTLPLPRGHRHFLHAAIYPLRDKNTPAPAAPHPSLGVPPTDTCPLAADADGRYIPLAVADCHHSAAPITLQNPSTSPALLCAFVQKRLYEGTHCVHNVFEARRYIDVTNRDAVAAFLRNTYDRYAAVIPDRFHAGAGAVMSPIGQVEAFFTDEPSFMGCYINKGLYPPRVRDNYDEDIPLYPVLSFGRDVENAFRSRYAYDLLPEFVSIFLGDTPHAMQVRNDYYTLLSDLYEQSFFVPISDWCARNRTSFSGHLLLEDTIKHHTVFEGNFFSLLRHMHIPGIDMLQSLPALVRRDAFTPKVVSSVAHLYGRPHVMSEVSAHAQGGRVTHDQMYASLCAQYALGVDTFTYYYGEHFMDPATYTRYNTALARIHAIMAGRTVTDCLVYYPIETFRLHHRPSDAQYGTYTAAEEACERELSAVMNTLLDHQIDFDFVDRDTLARFTPTEGGILSPTGERYTTLILPPMEYTPIMADTLASIAERVNILAVTAEAAACEGCITPSTLPDYIPRRALSVESPAPGVLRLVRDTACGRACLLCNTGETTATLTLSVAGMDQPVLYDPMEDAILPYARLADSDTIECVLPPMATYIIREKEA